MISHIRGKIENVDEDHIVVDVGGIGYLIFVPLRDLENVFITDTEIKIFTYLNIRQDGADLFGFASKHEREIFRLLLKVSGIGPKLAMSILSGMTAGEIAFAIINEDSKRFEAVSGVGKKTAQRIILELKGNKNLFEYIGERKIDKTEKHKDLSLSSEVMEILEGLGCTQVEAANAVRTVMKKSGIDISRDALLDLCLLELNK